MFAIVLSIAGPNLALPASVILGARVCGAGQEDPNDEVANVGGLASPQIHARRGSIRSARRDATLNHFAPPASRLSLMHIAAIGSAPHPSVLFCRINC